MASVFRSFFTRSPEARSSAALKDLQLGCRRLLRSGRGRSFGSWSFGSWSFGGRSRRTPGGLALFADDGELSADLDELRALASRILVIARGTIVAEVPPSTSDDEIGRLMLGGAHA